MGKLDTVQQDLFEVVGDVRAWCKEQYDSIFAKYFEGVPELYTGVTEQSRKMTDSEIEWILTSVPLQLISVSEELSQYKLNIECLKLYIKQQEAKYVSESNAKTLSQKKDEAAIKVMDYQLLLKAYNSVASRVDNEINFARELVMSSKKIWDSRKKVYTANPVSPTDLDSYSI